MGNEYLASKQGSSWTEEEVDEMHVDFKNGMPPSKIAEKYERGLGGIIGQLVKSETISQKEAMLIVEQPEQPFSSK